MGNPWRLSSGILAALLVVSVAIQVSGSRPTGGSGPAVSAGSPGSASGAGLIPITVAITGNGTAGSTGHEFGTALALGAFALQGLDVKWVSFQPTTSLLISALMSNQVQFMNSGISPFLVAGQKEINVSYLYNGSNFGNSSFLFARKALSGSVKSAADLKSMPGLRCGGGSPGTTTYATITFYEKIYGFKCATRTVISGTSVGIGSMQAGTIDVISATSSQATLYVGQGAAYVLVNPAEPATFRQLFGGAGGAVPFTGWLAMSSYVQANPGIVQKFVNGLLMGDAFIKSHTLDQVARLIKRLPDVGETTDQIKLAVEAGVPFRPENPDVSQQDWTKTLSFIDKFLEEELRTLKMTAQDPAYAYGTFWNAQFVEKSPFFVP